MTDAVGKEILIEGADPRELYGPRNVYLDQMKSLHPQLRIVARGSSLKVLGSEAETRRFEERMEGLVAYYSCSRCSISSAGMPPAFIRNLNTTARKPSSI